MSSTYYYICPETRKKVWCGQRSAGANEPYLYNTNEVLQEVTSFMIAHEGKDIRFVSCHYFEALDHLGEDGNFEEWTG